MTEDQIERHVERCVNCYDAAFMDGRIDQMAYDRLMREINNWADEQYRIAAAVKFRSLIGNRLSK